MGAGLPVQRAHLKHPLTCLEMVGPQRFVQEAKKPTTQESQQKFITRLHANLVFQACVSF